MGNATASLACLTRVCATDDAAQYQSDQAAVLHVALELTSCESRAMLEVPLRRALWTAPIASLKHALVVAATANGAPELLDAAATTEARIPANESTGHKQPTLDLPLDHEQPNGNSTVRVFLALLACGRCGRPRGCSCGWRSEHAISATHESLSLAQLLPRILPFVSTGELSAPRSIHVKIFESSRPPVASLEAAVVRFKIVDPMVESLRAVFTIDVQYGEQKWSVSHRFREFVSLHDTLHVTAADASLPELPRSKWFSRLDPDFLHARRMALDQYIRSLLCIDRIRDSVALLAFLGAISTNQEKLMQPPPDSLSPLEVMHLRVLQHYVTPGDLLLFRSNGAISSLQRSVTGSEWDHVAVVVPRDTDDVNKGFLLLEATGDGVTALSLTTRLYAYSAFHTSRIVLRQLNTPLLSPAVRSELLLRFTNQVKGRPYGLGLDKVLRTDDRRPRDAIDTGRSDYFCSELVADAYKALGLIDATILPSNFWPSSFSLGAFVDVELSRHGASLGGAIAIDCQVLEVALAKRMAPST